MEVIGIGYKPDPSGIHGTSTKRTVRSSPGRLAIGSYEAFTIHIGFAGPMSSTRSGTQSTLPVPAPIKCDLLMSLSYKGGCLGWGATGLRGGSGGLLRGWQGWSCGGRGGRCRCGGAGRCTGWCGWQTRWLSRGYTGRLSSRLTCRLSRGLPGWSTCWCIVHQIIFKPSHTRPRTTRNNDILRPIAVHIECVHPLCLRNCRRYNLFSEYLGSVIDQPADGVVTTGSSQNVNIAVSIHVNSEN